MTATVLAPGTRRSRTGAFVASGHGESAATAGKAHDVLRGLRELEERMEHPPVVAPTSRTTVQRPLWRKAISGAFNVCIVAGAIYFWPARFGGSTNAVLVRGTSMLPRYQLNDVVLVREKSDYEIGDIVLFEIPEGNAKGMTIIHRIIAEREDGTWETQGDNRPTPDQFHLTDEDLVGTPVLHIPKAGRILQLMRNTFLVAGAVGIGSVLLLWPSGQARPKGRKPGDQDTNASTGDDPIADVATTEQGFVTIEISQRDLDELDEALAGLLADQPTDDPADAADTSDVAGTPIEVPDDPAEDPEAAAARWLAEELAALGIDV